jgi:hypothetical protein
VSTALSLQKFRRLEPDFFAAHRDEYTRALAIAFLEETKSIGDKDRAAALRLLAASVKMKPMPLAICDALVYVMTPEFVVEFVRRYRRWRRLRRQAQIA